MNEKKSVFDIIKQGSMQDILSDIEKLESLDTTIVNENGQSPLHLAVLNNQLPLAAVLLNKGFSPNLKDKTMLSPFIASAANGLSEMFQLLLQYEPDLAHVNRFGGSALHPSSEKGLLRVVQPALDAGVPVDYANRLGWTALLEAVALGDGGYLYQEIVAELIAYGADASLKDFDQKSSIDYAREYKDEAISRILESGSSTSAFSDVKVYIRSNDFYQSIKLLLAMEESPEQLYYLAFTYECMNELETARYYYERGLEKDPQFAYYLANLSKKARNVDQALAYFDKGIETSNKRAFFTYHKSNYLREVGRHQEAIAVMDDLLSEDPGRVDYMFHKANSLRTLGNHQAAYEAMIQASLLQPSNQLFIEHAEQSKREIEKSEAV